LSKRKKSSSKQDKSYQHPIPNRGKVLDFLREAGRPLKVESLLEEFGLKGQKMRTQLVETLRKMVRAGQIIEKLQEMTQKPMSICLRVRCVRCLMVTGLQ